MPLRSSRQEWAHVRHSTTSGLVGRAVKAVYVALLTAALLSSAGPVFGADLPEPYQPPRSIVRAWAKSINFALIGTAGLLIVYTLTFRRRHLEETSAKWMLFTGICLLPAPVMVLSAAVGLEQSKDVNFCMSCHVMQPFIQDLKDPASKTLAAIHYQNRYIQREHCYRCHTDYGILGTMEAKKAGLGHVWKAATSSYQLPIAMAKPYSYSICLDCHADSVKFNQEAAHEGIVRDTLAGKSTCVECHDPPHPPPEARNQP